MHFSKEYNIDQIGITSARYIFSHLETSLIEKGFIITNKSDNELKYQYKYLYFWCNWTLASLARAGRIRITAQGTTLNIKLAYTDYWIFIISFIISFIICLLMYFQIGTSFGKPDYKNVFFVFAWLFGGNFIVRYIAQGIVFKNINKIINELSS